MKYPLLLGEEGPTMTAQTSIPIDTDESWLEVDVVW